MTGKTRIKRITQPRKKGRLSEPLPDLDILVTQGQVAHIQQLQAYINTAQERRGLYIRAILDSVGLDGDVKIAGPVKRGSKFYLEVTKITNPKKNGEV